MGARFFPPVQTDPGANPASYTTGTGFFPWVKRPRSDVDHLPPSSAEVKERVELLSLWAFAVGCRVSFTFIFTLVIYSYKGKMKRLGYYVGHYPVSGVEES